MSIMTIPRPLHIAIDDLGWFCSTDDRTNGGPSRTGVTRRHCYKDYEAINELGRRLDMKISCAFILGEWDPDNRLKSVKCLSKYGDNWNNAEYLDKKEMQKCIDVINSSEYIDLTVHGLLHGYYTEGIDNTDESDYYYKVNKELFMIPEAEVRHRLDCFFDLLKYYRVDKRVNAFIPPSFTYRWNEISKILADYGIEYVSTIFKTMKYDGECKTIAEVEDNGIINVDRNNNLIPWNQFNSDFSKISTEINGVLGSHWPNFLHEDADRNLEVIDKAVKFFEKCSQNFGTVISKDIKFCATQSLFCRYAKIDEKDGVTTIDITNVPRYENMNKVFYVSSRFPILEAEGGKITEYDRKKNFITYEIDPEENIIILK